MISKGFTEPAASKPYGYNQMKQSTMDYHIDKMLQYDTIMSIVSLVVLCKNYNGRVLMILKNGDLLLIIVS